MAAGSKSTVTRDRNNAYFYLPVLVVHLIEKTCSNEQAFSYSQRLSAKIIARLMSPAQFVFGLR
jgi:hypothetical protein